MDLKEAIFANRPRPDGVFAALVVCAGAQGRVAVPEASTAHSDVGVLAVDSIEEPSRPAVHAGGLRAWADGLPVFATPATPHELGENEDGFDVVEISGRPFQRPLIDLVRSAHPGAVWDVVSFAGETAARAVAEVRQEDGDSKPPRWRTVGIVMGLRR